MGAGAKALTVAALVVLSAAGAAAAGEPAKADADAPEKITVETSAGWILEGTRGRDKFNALWVDGLVLRNTDVARVRLETGRQAGQWQTRLGKRGPAEPGPAAGHTHRPDESLPLPFGWRGDGNGVYPGGVAPDEVRVVWRLPLAGWTHGSPILANGRLFLLDHPHTVVCIDPGDGRVLWARANPIDLCGMEREKLGYPANDFVAQTYEWICPTPIADGENVYASFGHGVVACYRQDGTRLWASGFRTEQIMRSGVSQSPALLDDLVVTGGASFDAFAAYDRRTGEQRWRAGRGGGVRGKGALLSVEIDGRRLLLPSDGMLYDRHGQLVMPSPIQRSYGPTPVVHDGVAYITDSAGKELMAVRMAPGKPEVLWRRQWPGNCGSPVLLNGLLFYPGKGGLLMVDAATGKDRGSAPVEGTGGWFPSSPIVAGDRVVFVGRKEITVVAADPEPRVVSTFAHPFHTKVATHPIVDGNRLYYRDNEALWCLACDDAGLVKK